MTPTVGRIVQYRFVDPPGTDGDPRWLAALVTVGGPAPSLRVFLDPSAVDVRIPLLNLTANALRVTLRTDLDINAEGVVEGTAVGCWRWPPREGIGIDVSKPVRDRPMWLARNTALALA